jgi:hypothetical protein
METMLFAIVMTGTVDEAMMCITNRLTCISVLILSESGELWRLSGELLERILGEHVGEYTRGVYWRAVSREVYWRRIANNGDLRT